jgi:hypothetical protein
MFEFVSWFERTWVQTERTLTCLITGDCSKNLRHFYLEILVPLPSLPEQALKILSFPICKMRGLD